MRTTSGVFPALALVALLFALLPAAPARAGTHAMVQRFDCGLSWKANDRLEYRAITSHRFLERMGDFYFFGLDTGPTVKLGSRFQLPVLLRLFWTEGHTSAEDASGAVTTRSDWRLDRFLLVDPAVRLGTVGPWRFDFRNRFQVGLNPGSRELLYLRLLPKVTRSVRWGARRLDCYLANDFYLITSDTLRRQGYHANYFNLGVKVALSPRAELDPCYKIFSSTKTGSPWKHAHQLQFAVNFKL